MIKNQLLSLISLMLFFSCGQVEKSGIKGNENDNNKVVIGDNSKIDESVTHVHNYEGEEGLKVQKGVHMLNSFEADQMHIGNLLFPLKIIDFIGELGEPSKINLFPPDEISGPGSSCDWIFKKKNIVFTVITDDYDSERLDYNTGSDFFLVKLIDKRKKSDIIFPMKTYLGMPYNELMKNIKNFTSKNDYWRYEGHPSRDEYRNLIDNAEIMVTNDKHYLKFVTNGRRLIEIHQLSYNWYQAG